MKEYWLFVTKKDTIVKGLIQFGSIFYPSLHAPTVVVGKGFLVLC